MSIQSKGYRIFDPNTNLWFSPDSLNGGGRAENSLLFKLYANDLQNSQDGQPAPEHCKSSNAMHLSRSAAYSLAYQRNHWSSAPDRQGMSWLGSPANSILLCNLPSDIFGVVRRCVASSATREHQLISQMAISPRSIYPDIVSALRSAAD